MNDIPAFTDDEFALIRLIRHAEIRVTQDGRLEILHLVSDESAAAELHKLLRPVKP